MYILIHIYNIYINIYIYIYSCLQTYCVVLKISKVSTMILLNMLRNKTNRHEIPLDKKSLKFSVYYFLDQCFLMLSD